MVRIQSKPRTLSQENFPTLINPINCGLNGLGRIGKCVLLQILGNPKYSIKAINVPQLKATELSDYLSYDSTHHYDSDSIGVNDIEVINENLIRIKGQDIVLLRDRVAKNLPWRALNVQYLIDATGAYLTTEKCDEHDVDHVLMSAPPKDPKITPTFIYGVNDVKYTGQKSVSASSCTTNCMAPMLKLVNDTFGIDTCNFTTIHATTGSQHVVDVATSASRTNRSIINNMIPHSTGASKSLFEVIPELKGKIWGTSIRVPTINCSLVDCNVECTDKEATIEKLEAALRKSKYYGVVYSANNKLLTSCDFLTTTTPTIMDCHASMNMAPGQMKLALWYDNEWSYSAQMIRVMESMFEYDCTISHPSLKYSFNLSQNYSLGALGSLKDESVVGRFDFNVPVDNDRVVMDDLRLKSAVPTITHILNQKVKRLVICAHFGRPKGVKNDKDSIKFLVPLIEKMLKLKVTFLPHGVSSESLEVLKSNEGSDSGAVYLLENIRFHPEEEAHTSTSELSKMYLKLGNVIISDSFASIHRPHMSVTHLTDSALPGRKFGYGFLMEQEVLTLSVLLQNEGKKVLGILGGARLSDKKPYIDCLSTMPLTRIFIGGGVTKGWSDSYPITPATVILSQDGYGADSLALEPMYLSDINKNNGGSSMDIGPKGIHALLLEIDNADVIFWNGSLGIIEDPRYITGSKIITDYLLTCTDKHVIIGGGETASLFKNKKAEHVYISTGGNALLEHVQSQVMGKAALPGLACFNDGLPERA